MPNMALCADTNNGKTRLLRYFMSQHKADENLEGEAIIVKVLYLQCPGVPDEARLYDSILTKLCVRFRPSASPREKLPLVLDVLRRIGLRVLIVDETNYAESGSAIKQKAFLNALRYLGGELQIAIVTAGTEEMLRVIRTVPAVENRFEPTFLPLWEDNKEYRGLLASFERLIPIEEPSNLASDKLATLIHSRCGGKIGEKKMLLAKSLEYAINNGKRRIDQKVIDACGYRSPSARKRSKAPI
jgi:hypothetical protein